MHKDLTIYAAVLLIVFTISTNYKIGLRQFIQLQTTNYRPQELVQTAERYKLIKDLCDNQGGTYDLSLKRCNGISEEVCLATGGHFDECASPCEPDAKQCILLCVQTCYYR